MKEIQNKERILIERLHNANCKDKTTIHYFVPKIYEYDGKTGKKLHPDVVIDISCMVPHVKFDKKINKWGLYFSETRSSSDDARFFVYYFDDLNDILTFMDFPLSCNCS